MDSPYNSSFKVTQIQSSSHDGLDLVGIGSKNIYTPIDGVVRSAGWENSKNLKQGFGLYVSICDAFGDVYYFGHLSKTFVKKGQVLRKGDLIGIEGNTGYSFGSHLHYCCRFGGKKDCVRKISFFSDIPNKIGIYNQYVVKRSWKAPLITITPYITQARKIAKRYKAVIYDEEGKTISSYR